MQIIPRDESFGSILGSGLGELAGRKIGQLLKTHQQEQERSEFAKTWEPYLGKSTANFLSNLGPEERRNALGNLEQLTGAFGQPGQKPNGLAALGQNQQPTSPFGQQQPDQQQIQQAIQQYFGHPQSSNQQFGQQGPQQQALGQQQSQEQTPQLTPERAQLIQGLFETPEQRKEKALLEKENRKEAALARKESYAEQAAADKETKKYFESALDLEKAADFSDLRLKKMENLIKKGGLPISGFYNLFKKLEEDVPAAYGAAAGGGVGAYAGGPVGAAIGSAIGGLISPIGTMLRFAQKRTSPNLEEFEKLSNDFIKDAKAVFGSRITDNDLKAFMATIPTLGQTDEGKLAIINNMKMFNRASRIRAEAVKDVIRANGNRRPHNLQLIVEDRIKPQLDQLSQEFSVV